MWNNLTGISSIVFYLIPTFILVRHLMAGEPAGKKEYMVQLFVLVAILLHCLTLYHTIITNAGVRLGFFNTLSITSLVVVMLFVLTTLIKPVGNLGVFIYPGSALSIILMLSLESDYVSSTVFNPGLDIHIILALLAYSLLSIAAVQSIVLAYQDSKLRQRKPGGFLRSLPPLQTMETLLFQLITLGLFLLTLAIISGFIFLDDMFAQKVAHKTILTIIAWFIFATLLWGRWKFGWRGPKAIRWSLSGFAALLLAFFGSKLVIDLIL